MTEFLFWNNLRPKLWTFGSEVLPGACLACSRLQLEPLDVCEAYCAPPRFALPVAETPLDAATHYTLTPLEPWPHPETCCTAAQPRTPLPLL